ncbi:RNA polymerase subunit sigma, partial [Paraburkholderia bengalensis]
PATRAAARQCPGRPSRGGTASGDPPSGGAMQDGKGRTQGGWMPHAPGALPGGLAQEAPDGL